MSKVYSIGLKCKCGEYVTFDIVPKVAADIVESAPSASTNTLRDAIALLVECRSKLIDIMGECDSAFNCDCLPMRVKRFIDAQQHQ
jgi:hypothetical protein